MSSTEGGHSRAQSPSNLAASHFKSYHPYFVPSDVEFLVDRQRLKSPYTQEDKVRQNACGFLETMGARIGLCVEVFILFENMGQISVPALTAHAERSLQLRHCTIDFIYFSPGRISVTS